MGGSSSQAKNEKRSIIGTFFNIIFVVMATYFGSLALSIIVEFLGIYNGWWDQPGHLHVKEMLRVELAYLSQDFKSIMVSPIDFAVNVVNLTYYYMVKVTGFEWLILQLQQSVAYEYLLSAAYMVQLNAVRTAVIILSLPAVLLLGLYAIIDGLTERDLRTWGLGHETSFIYHHAKNLKAPLFYLPMLVYLSLPISIPPSYFTLIFAIPFAYSLWLISMYFKKYV